MNSFLRVNTLEELESLKGRQGLSPIDSQTFLRHAPDAHWVYVRDESITAYCSLWWRNAPSYPGKRLGLIGHYAAQEVESARFLLDRVCEELVNQGCTQAVGPMDGNTWQRYRWVTERGQEPMFFLEPDNPDEWVEHWYDRGFVPLAEYYSALNVDLTQCDPRLAKVEERLERLGVSVRSLNLAKFPQELESIHPLSLISFQPNFLYTPISQAEFIAQYSQIQPYVRSELVLLAEQDDRLVGFVFALPDWLQAQRGEAINTVIIKTVAILPGRAYAGLGNVLVARVQAIAHQLGYRRAIHALMHEANPSRNLSRHYAVPIRRYTLLAKDLGQLNTDSAQ